jgi:hypothetical protein
MSCDSSKAFSLADGQREVTDDVDGIRGCKNAAESLHHRVSPLRDKDVFDMHVLAVPRRHRENGGVTRAVRGARSHQ